MARVLVVDDNQTILEFTKDILHKYAKTAYTSEWELQVTTVTNAISALELMNEHIYELIITDILMARMDGWEFIKEIRKRFPEFNTPIVVMSAAEGIDLNYESMRHGASAWFYKPLHPKEFATEVFKLIQER